MDHRMQEEMCKLLSSKYDADETEIAAFGAVMRFLKYEYSSKPEVYKTIVGLLQDYNPQSPAYQRSQIKKYLSMLLAHNQECADYLLENLL